LSAAVVICCSHIYRAHGHKIAGKIKIRDATHNIAIGVGPLDLLFLGRLVAMHLEAIFLVSISTSLSLSLSRSLRLSLSLSLLILLLLLLLLLF
jgi:hypothetical protein